MLTQARLNGVLYYAHRLAWLYVHGSWPAGVIDHVDPHQKKNSIADIREATTSQNMANARMFSHNTSGVKGVSFIKRSRKWRAYAKLHGRQYNLGEFTNKADAAAARDRAHRALHGPFARKQ